MSTGGARRGRRDNGLDAADYAVAGDVDPRVGEHLLDVLAADGIAAYLQPSADLNPLLRTTTFPSRPTDRLFVDRTQLEAARAQLHKLTGGVSPTAPQSQASTEASQSDVDAEWAKIIAGFHTMPEEKPAWPDSESADKPRPSPPMPSATDISGITLNRRRTDPQPVQEPSLLDGLDTFGEDVPDDDEDRYIPPPPPPLPRISKYAVAGVLAIVVGFLLFLRPTLIPVDADLVTLIGFTAIVAGAVTLVWRLRSGDDDDEYDDGAVV
ncbi:DUF308 domain-containing protein [Actinoplanes sp. NBRC 103695]|uniref:DUF308 domain-containing protein n=1 Tax=Actinoplanes sp. NBRC 103695 TaxID=3032202 RepID=UPI0024A10C68|nr:DUF308 domain-containing protein [Actinoplanes sp. NBRC 103695]GLY93384.1 hypothetical protein Acsp02_06400 [Actinoplanes sp. NBRC 103695]